MLEMLGPDGPSLSPPRRSTSEWLRHPATLGDEGGITAQGQSKYTYFILRREHLRVAELGVMRELGVDYAA